MSAEESTENKPKDSIGMDQYGTAAQQYIRARTAKTSAAFFLGHLAPGMDLLDCGCGEGTITVGLAETIAPGTVTGVDMAPATIERARNLATELGVKNAQFEVGSVYALPFPDASFDAVFSHALFEHLTDKNKALSEIWRVLKPGGIVGLRAPDLAASIFELSDPLLDQFWHLFARIRDELGGESNVGRRLSGLLAQAKFTNVQGSASFESVGTAASFRGVADLWAGFTLKSPYADEWLARGWVERENLELIAAAWRDLAEQPGAFMATAWGEAMGQKQ